MSAMSDYLENKLVDQIFRGQPFSFPATLYFALFTANPTDTGGGTEVTGGSYARVAVTASMTNFAGTQASGSTTASNGSSATTSNNTTISFPAPTANWGTITGMAIFDAATGGNMLFWSPLSASKNVNNGDASPSFQPGAFIIQLDN